MKKKCYANVFQDVTQFSEVHVELGDARESVVSVRKTGDIDRKFEIVCISINLNLNENKRNESFSL